MWIIFTTIYYLLQATVNYLDEYLTNNIKVTESINIHSRVGALLIVSALLNFIGCLFLFFFLPSVNLPIQGILLGVFSAVPLLFLLGSYFYLLLIYPVYQVVPLFQLSTLWLLLIELGSGGSITTIGIIGILLLIIGEYILDSGSLSWKVPSKLFFAMIPVTLSWSLALYMARISDRYGSIEAFNFWQMMGTGVIGVVLIICIKQYREGFIFRIKRNGKNFLKVSFLNEALAQTAYFINNIGIALAPVIAYTTALSGVQSIFLLFLCILFPLKEKAHINGLQILAIVLIAVGVFLIEIV